MSLPVQPMDTTALVLAVNAWGTGPRRARGEHEAPLPSPRDVTTDPLLLPEPVARLVDLADAAYPAFTGPNDETRAAVVTTLLERSGVRPALLSDGGLRSGWVVPAAARLPLAAAALALWLQLGAGPGERLGTCADHACEDAYVDASPAGRRRFCSVTCQNRARAAAYRHRRRRRAG